MQGLIAMVVSSVLVLAMPTQTGASGTPAASTQRTRIVLVGASIGEGWNFAEIGTRIRNPAIEFSSVGVYDFDKSRLIDALSAARDKPDVVLIKECSTYFPGDLPEYERKVMAWVRRLRGAGIEPVLVTTAPIGAPSGTVGLGKNMLRKALGSAAPLDAIIAFNDWMKDYAAREHIAVFDLEEVLRRGPRDRFMKPEYDAGDRVHLSRIAYRALDEAFARFLSEHPVRGERR